MLSSRGTCLHLGHCHNFINMTNLNTENWPWAAQAGFTSCISTIWRFLSFLFIIRTLFHLTMKATDMRSKKQCPLVWSVETIPSDNCVIWMQLGSFSEQECGHVLMWLDLKESGLQIIITSPSQPASRRTMEGFHLPAEIRNQRQTFICKVKSQQSKLCSHTRVWWGHLDDEESQIKEL